MVFSFELGLRLPQSLRSFAMTRNEFRIESLCCNVEVLALAGYNRFASGELMTWALKNLLYLEGDSDGR